MNYSATGNLAFNDETSKNPWLRKGKTKAGADYETLNLSVVESPKNRLYAEKFGMVQSEIKTMDVDKNKITVSWDDRTDADIVKVVAGYKKSVANLDGSTRKEFIADIDFIDYLAENIDTLKAGKFTVTGQVNKNFYNGKMSDRFTINNIYLANDETKNQLRITAEAFWTKDDVDTNDWKEEHKIYINGYVQAYIDKDNGTKYVPQQFIFDASKIDFANEKHVKLLKYKLHQLGLDYEDGKIVNNLKAKKVYKLTLICNYVNGNEEIPFDEKSLTPNQKESIELGLKTLDDFKPKGQAFGNRVTLYKIVDFDLRGDASDGAYDADMTPSELEEEIYMPPKVESIDDVVAEAESKAEETNDTDDDDLFA